VSHVAKEHYFEGSHNLEESSDFEGIGQGSLDYASSEGVGQGSLDYTSSEGKPGFQGSPGLEGSLSSKVTADTQKTYCDTGDSFPNCIF